MSSLGLEMGKFDNDEKNWGMLFILILFSVIM